MTTNEWVMILSVIEVLFMTFICYLEFKEAGLI
jgi:hypothetical protein